MLNTYQSPATAYEIVLTELNKSHHSKDEKILKVFEVVDEIIPNLGVYYKIMRIVRQQLFDAVFSNEFTAARPTDQNAEAKIQRKSYYLLYKDILDIKDGKVDAIKEELKEKDEILKRKEIMLNQFISLNENLKLEIKEAKKQIETLNRNLDSRKTEIYHLEKKFASNETLYTQKIDALKNNIEYLSEDLEHRATQMKDLSVYKESFDEIHKTFSPSHSERTVKSAKKPIGANRKNQVIVDILNAKKFEEQLFALINVSTEEYDDFMERQQEYLLEKYKKSLNSENSSISNRFNDMKPFLSSFEKDILTKQMEAEKLNYQKSISDLKNQYELIVQHRQALEEKLSLLEQDRENSEFIKKQKSKTANTGGAAQGLEEHYEPIRNGADRDPYSVQDRIYSKFACTMHISNNGKYWNDLKLVKHCENCGDKTLICPHKLTLDEAIIKLPTNTNYLKFSRPKLRINQNLVKRSLESFKKPDTEYQVGDNTIVLTNYKTQYPQIERDDLNRETVNLLTKGNPDIGMPNDFRRVWKDYEARTSYRRQVQRPFSYDRTISIIMQFLAYLHTKELDREYEPKDIVNSLYDYMEVRYENEEIKYAAVYDFLTSIHLYALKSRFIEMFCNVIVGNLDRGILNYILYMGEIIDKIDWQETEDAKIFMAIIYPFCDEDDLENLALDFISFSENKINKKLVWEFIMSLVIKRKDFIVNEMEFRLKEKQSEHEIFMSENEFCDVLNEFFFVADERQLQVAYKTSLSHAVWDGQQVASIRKLSNIAAYYCLLQLINDMKENITKIIEDSRKQTFEHDSKFGPPPVKNQKSEYQDEFIKFTDIVDLAQSIIRFKNAEFIVEEKVESDIEEEEEENNNENGNVPIDGLQEN